MSLYCASTSATILSKYGPNCQHAYADVPKNTITSNNPGKCNTARTIVTSNDVTMASEYPTIVADSPAGSARPMSGCNHPGAGFDASGGTMSCSTIFFTSGDDPSARTTTPRRLNATDPRADFFDRIDADAVKRRASGALVGAMANMIASSTFRVCRGACEAR